MSKEHFPLPPINEMSKKDRKAFDEGTWDGIEKRSHKNPKKEELAAKRRHQRRLKDRQNAVVYYSVLSILFIMAFVMIAGTVIFQMVSA